MNRLTLYLASQPATEALAARIAGLLRPGDALLLSGDLGAGKSTFARALLRHLAGNPELEVPSPTFTLQQSYDTPIGPVHHFDLWRLGDPAELIELGWDEVQRDVILVEWPERLGEFRPEGALEMAFAILDGDERQVTVTGWTDRLGELQ